jgi:hypothetical protein
MNGSAFIEASLCLVDRGLRIDPRNRHFVITREFLVDQIDRTAARFFDSVTNESIWRDIKILGKSCFGETKVQSLTFDRGTQLRRLEGSSFARSALKSIFIPPLVEAICKSRLSGAEIETP